MLQPQQTPQAYYNPSPFDPQPPQLQQAYQQPQPQQQLLAPQPQPQPQTQASSPPSTSRKRKAPGTAPVTGLQAMSSTGLADPGATGQEGEEAAETSLQIQAPKKSRTNTPWTPSEEQRLKIMRDQGNSWGEIAKVGESSCVTQGWVVDALQRRFPIGLKEVLKSIGTRYLSSFDEL